jgi:hypothetical protein
MPLIGFYSMSKWVIESLHESLALEVKALGINLREAACVLRTDDPALNEPVYLLRLNLGRA